MTNVLAATVYNLKKIALLWIGVVVARLGSVKNNSYVFICAPWWYTGIVDPQFYYDTGSQPLLI